MSVNISINGNPMMGGMDPLMGGMPGACGCNGAQGLNQLNRQMMQLQMMEMMMEMMELMMGGGGFLGNQMGMPGMDPFGMGGMPGMGGGMPGWGGGGMPGWGGGGGGIPSFGGGGGGMPGIGGGGGIPAAPGQFGPGGGASVDLARRFLGQPSYQLKGQLPGFTAAGGRTNNCADFVSSILQNTQGLKGQFVNVRGLESALQKQGWRQVPPNQAKAGDVWINHSRGHVELVSNNGPNGMSTIGSNNNGVPGFQRYSERGKGYGTGVVYTRG